MPRSLSSTARTAINAQETGEVFLHLLTISHPLLTPPLRFVYNTVDITSRGDVYKGAWFEITLPQERDDAMPSVQLQIENVDQEIMRAIRTLSTPPAITLEVILASAPDVVEAGPFDFTIRGVEYDTFTITATLAHEDVLNEPYPHQSFTPGQFPGLFP